jgi:uncharacterized protein YfdQ (DUF2303 family)
MSEIDVDTANLIERLAIESGASEVIAIETDGLGKGLPPAVPVLFDRREQTAQSLKQLIEEWRQSPSRRRGEAKVETLKSFVDLVNRHKDEDTSAIFGTTAYPKISLTCVLDYHSTEGKPGWREHKIVYPFPLTDEFKTWAGNNKQPMSQCDFAAFLEEHAAELAAPYDAEVVEYEQLFGEKFATPNELIALSRSLEVHVGAKVAQGIRLSSGERTVEFKEEHSTKSGEKVEIPGLFMVSVPLWIDGDPVRIPALLRYRIGGGSVTWFYQLYRWEFWLRNQILADLEYAGRETDLPTFLGTPE